MSNRSPNYNLIRTTLDRVRFLFQKYHGYKSVGGAATYVFSVEEEGEPVAAFVWQPPPPGAAKSVCPEAPYAVLALSRMVAVPRHERRLRHISKPLRQQMVRFIDRGRWPVLVTYSDEGQGHTGHVYKCSGWEKTHRASVKTLTNSEGARVSAYANGRSANHKNVIMGRTFIQRWEHWACARGFADIHVRDAGWERQIIPGKTWASGNPKACWKKVGDECGVEV